MSRSELRVAVIEDDADIAFTIRVNLEREGYVQLAYKHAVSTIQPVTAVDLTDEWEGEVE